MVLLDKYLSSRPTHRLCQELEHHGLPLSQGTLTDGLQRLMGLFEPLMPVLYERQMTEKLFHGDETRWEVCEEVEGKTGHRWYLWVMQSVSVVYYRMAPGRGADVPKGHFAKLRKDLLKVVLVCDRYSAYKSLALDCDELILAFCWAHVRRDFLRSCACILRVIPKARESGTIPPFSTGVRGHCRDIQPRFLPARAHRPGVVVPDTLWAVAIGACCRSPKDTQAAA